MTALKLPGRFFRVSAADNWRDHGTILTNGFIGEPFVKDGPASLYRTGPFIPAVTVPNNRVTLRTQRSGRPQSDRFAARDDTSPAGKVLGQGLK